MPITGGGTGDATQISTAERTSGNVATTSTTFVAMDATNLAVTMTTTGGDVLVAVILNGYNSNSSSALLVDIDVDGTREGGTTGLALGEGADAQSNQNLCFATIIPGLSAASHTFKIMIAVTAGTGTFYAGSGTPARIAAMELKN